MMRWTLLHQIALLLLLCGLASSFLGKKSHYGLSKTKVVAGTENCVTNCSTVSGDRTVFCAVQECTVIPTAIDNPQAPEIEEVYFEVFADEKSGKNRLALNVKWTPVDNVSLERSTGYRITISDGVTTFQRCYNISTSLDFSKDTKLISYSDCYGKAEGTEVRLGSRIRVSVSGLPPDQWNDEYSTTNITVDVPDCQSEDTLIATLWECEKEREKLGPRPTKEECTETCNTYSEVGGVVYPVKCSVSQSELLNRGPETCIPVNKTISGSPSQPLRVPQTVEWYKFIADDGKVKLALNYSWTPAHDASITAIEGYYMEVLDKGIAGTTSYNKCFSVHTVLEEGKHSNAEFFYDCYGRERTSHVRPGHSYLVHIESRPRSPDRLFLKFDISVPNCVDPSMQDVTECIEENSKYLNAEVEEIFCHNRSMKYKYSISKEYGDRATVVFCERGPNLVFCKNELVYSADLELENTLYNISLPSSANLSVGYTIYVHGNNYPGERNKSHPDFSSCVVQKPYEESNLVLMGILIAGVVILLLIIIFLLYRYLCGAKLPPGILKKFCRRGGDRDGDDMPQTVVPPDTDHFPPRPPPSPEPPITRPQEIPRPRVYVICMEDHEIHKEVVHWFCSYLKGDLGLDIRLSMWDNLRVTANPTMYMTENLKLADKVIIICSAGTKNCLDRQWDGKDMFTPVVRNIIQDSFVGKNPGKFLVGYFGYSEQSDVPEYLYDQTMMYFSLFKLMKQFEQFYFRLVGIEQFQEGGIQRIEKIAFDRYYDPLLTSCGAKLKATIEEMTRFVRENPNWYTDRHGSDLPGANLPPTPTQVRRPVVPQPDQQTPVGTATYRAGPDNVTDGMASINLLHLSNPPELPNGNTGARPRRPNDQQQLHTQVPQQHWPNQRDQHYGSRVPNNAQPHGPGTSMMSQSSGDESFVVPETETEDLSCTTRGSTRPPMENDEFSRDETSLPMTAEEFEPSFFSQDDDLGNQASLDSRLLSDLPSNETQITRLGYPEEHIMPRLPESEILISIDGVADNPPESGVYTLASLSADDDDVDLEEEFKSINQLV